MNQGRFLDQTWTSQANLSMAIDQRTASTPQSAPNQSAASPGQATSNPRRKEARRNSHRNPQPIFGPGSEERRSSRRRTGCVYPQSKLRGFTDVRKRRLVCFLV